MIVDVVKAMPHLESLGLDGSIGVGWSSRKTDDLKASHHPKLHH